MRISAAALLLGAALTLGGGARADEKADALIQRAEKAAQAARSLQAEFELMSWTRTQRPPLTGTVQLLKPHYGRVKVNNPAGQPLQTMISTGKEQFIVLEGQKQYLKDEAAPKAAGVTGVLGPVGALFMEGSLASLKGERTLRAPETFNGQSYQVVEVAGPDQPTYKLFFGPAGRLDGSEMQMKQGEQTFHQRVLLKNVRLNAPLKPQEFAYKPPAGYKPYERPDFEKSLLAVGKPAPSFRLPQPGGAELALEDTLKDKKAVLINFWFYN